MTAKKFLSLLWRVLLQIAAAALFCVGWGIGCLMLAFSTPVAKFLYPAAALFLTGLFLVLHWALWKQKKVLWLGTALTILALLFSSAVLLYRWWTVDRFPQMNNGQIPWQEYAPFKGKKTIQVTCEEKYRLSGKMPTIDGAYALFPLYAAVVQSLCPPGDYREIVDTNGSDVTFARLLGTRFRVPVDMIFSAPPSQKQLKDAENLKLTYDITPFAREAFVFFVHKSNPVSNLSQEQIRKIYSGSITNWKSVGGPDIAIKPFQRNEGSGSQTMLQKIMGKTPIMPPVKEDRLGGMGEIINDVANYRNSRDAIGFSFRYFSTEMFKNGSIKLLSIDGIAPTLENIQNGTYPFITDCCVITCRPRSENTKKIVEFLFSPAGRELIQKVGYTPLPLLKE